MTDAKREEKSEVVRLQELLEREQFFRGEYFADASRVVRWIDDPDRLSSVESFRDDSPERRIAYAVEALLGRIKKQ